MDEQMLTLEKFEEASEVVKKVTLETKLVYSDYLSVQTGNRVYLKPENMQFTGAYKLRGAYYKMSTLTQEGCGLCGKLFWGQGYYCHAHHNPPYQGEPYQRVWSGSGTLGRCV